MKNFYLILVIIAFVITFFSIDNSICAEKTSKLKGELISFQDTLIEVMYQDIELKDRVIDSLEGVLTSFELLRRITGTMYHPVREQTDNTPHITADGSIIDIPNASRHKWIAVSRDLLIKNGGRFDYDDTVIIISNEGIIGTYTIHDCMADYWVNRIDFLESPGTPPYALKDLTILNLY